MMLKRIVFLFVAALSTVIARADAPASEPTTATVPLFGNTYVTAGPKRAVRIDAEGVRGWTDPTNVLSTYFSVGTPGELKLALCGKTVGEHPARIEVTVGGERFAVEVTNSEPGIIPVGTIRVERPGYVRVDMRGAAGCCDFGTYTALRLSGEAAGGRVTAIPEEDTGNWTYWGRRGPSVHMKYPAPAGERIRYFYNEVTVPEGEDVLHSYYMVNGFNGGYMGMQVNGPEPDQRRILFSVWSGYTTDNPQEIPEEYRVRRLRRGEGVHIGEFGNEGSGGQSYMYYPWEAGKTYRFITEVRPDGPERTVFTGYFCGHDGKWRLVASFMRPDPGKQHETYYTGMHSFLENFDPEMGFEMRKVYFGNQWAVTTDGCWIELTEGVFTIDNTGNSGIRLDYDGGEEQGRFYLRNCGFFDGTVPYGARFSRPATGAAPRVDLDALAGIPTVE